VNFFLLSCFIPDSSNKCVMSLWWHLVCIYFCLINQIKSNIYNVNQFKKKKKVTVSRSQKLAVNNIVLSYFSKVIWGHLLITLQITRQTPQTITLLPIMSRLLNKRYIYEKPATGWIMLKQVSLKFL